MNWSRRSVELWLRCSFPVAKCWCFENTPWYANSYIFQGESKKKRINKLVNEWMDVQKNKRGWTEKHELEKCGLNYSRWENRLSATFWDETRVEMRINSLFFTERRRLCVVFVSFLDSSIWRRTWKCLPSYKNVKTTTCQLGGMCCP